MRHSIHMVEYSEISDSGRSEIRTTSLQRIQHEVSRYFLPIVPTHFESPKEDTLLTKDKQIIPKCPPFGDSTVLAE
jgi:hypothetical protein